MATALKKIDPLIDSSSSPVPLKSLSDAYRPALDGVRAMACLSVVLFHSPSIFERTVEAPLAGLLSIFAWGAAGVDLFFVLSSFLLTRILLETKGRENYFFSFYAKRSLRIFPLYFATLGAIYLYFVLLGHGGDRISLWEPHRFSLWLFFSNITMGLYGPTPFGTLHFWSLATEEQFYLLWPITIFLMSRKNLLRVCYALMGASLVLRLVLVLGWNADSMFVRFILPTRIDCFAIGALLAIVSSDTAMVRCLTKFALVAGSAIVGFILLYVGNLDQSSTAFMTYGLTGNALIAGALVGFAHLSDPGSKAIRIFASSPFRALGKYSYGIYVLHFPLLRFLGPLNSGLPGDGWLNFIFKFSLYLGLSVALGALSWHLLEKHALKLKRYFPVGR